MKSVKLTVSALAVIAASASVAAARDQVQVAGSSTVLPYATIVAEAFAENSEFAAPVVEGGGSSAGLKQFCEGVGESDIRVNFGGVTFFSGDHLYADNTGIILSEDPLDIE